jgi:hypothetical protein
VSGRWLRVSERVYRGYCWQRILRNFGVNTGRRWSRRSSICAGKSGAAGFLRLWIRTILDLGTTAFVEWRSGSPGKEVGVNDYKLAGAGFALLLAPLYFVTASLLKYGLGIGLLFDPLDKTLMSHPENLRIFNLVSPVVFLGGLSLALLLNACAVLRLNFGREVGAVVGTVRLGSGTLRLWP